MHKFLILFFPFLLFAKIEVGVDRLLQSKELQSLNGKRVALVTNQTGVNGELKPTYQLLQEHCKLTALFFPEHGFWGSDWAEKKIKSGQLGEIPLYSLHGETRRPTKEMLQGLDLIIYDIQDIGVRSYTYASTLFYVMEEAAKEKIPVMVLDRPNPLGGNLVDGPMLEEKWRSFVGYVNVPYCHGMTIGELADFFNQEYKIGCQLSVIPMRGYKRAMTYEQTGLPWIPTSPNIPEADSALFCASTGILGQLELGVNIGVGYTLPFKVVGAPWIDAESFASALNKLKLSGVHFRPFHFTPFSGKLKNRECHGVLLIVTDQKTYKPLSVQFALLGILKSLYPESFSKALKEVKGWRREIFNKVCGSEKVLQLLENERYVTYKLLEMDRKEREAFAIKRKKYLRSEY
ncbi:MAG: DUF1343 domain-containing protein [Candidatus Algichlamydia australiensis]|nr:DUF1343 domain-containing protein [Chlamydiales bacterium]